MEIPTIMLRPKDEDDEDAPEILEKVELKLFRASPTSISSFGHSVISWKVEGPLGFQVLLLSETVPKSGSKIVTPASSTTYHIYARARGILKKLGTVEVTVDNQGCEIIALEDRVSLKPILEGTVEEIIKSPPINSLVYFRKIVTDPESGAQIVHPVFEFSPGRIRLILKLRGRVSDLPDPTIDIEASFGLTVTDGKIVPINDQINVSIAFPWWIYGVPGLQFALIMAIADGEKETRQIVRDAIYNDLAAFFNLFARPSDGKRLRTVKVDKGNGEGSIVVTACPYNLLTEYAKISESKAVVP